MEEKKISNENDNQINNENNKGNSLNNILSKTLKNTSSAFIISILSKIINLLFNIILIIHISKGAYGTVKIYLKFALSLVCFFPRETIRKTAQKFYQDKDNKRELNNYYLVCQVYTLILIPMIIYCFLLFIWVYNIRHKRKYENKYNSFNDIYFFRNVGTSRGARYIIYEFTYGKYFNSIDYR